MSSAGMSQTDLQRRCRAALASRWALTGAVRKRKTVISSSRITPASPWSMRKKNSAEEHTADTEGSRLGGAVQARVNVGEARQSDGSHQGDGGAEED